MDGQGGNDLSRNQDAPVWWRTRSGLVFVGFMAIAAYFLITEHRAHLALAIPYLPWLLLLSCPLMHLFMHHGHGGHGRAGKGSDQALNRSGTGGRTLQGRP